jgi:hypothetical protein
VREVRVFGNTVVAANRGISVSGGDVAYTQRVTGNAVFSAMPIGAASQSDNVTDSYANATAYLNNAQGAPGQLDLYPKPNTLRGPAIATGDLSAYAEWNLDFNGRSRDWTFRGAYAGEGTNPGWLPRLEPKP